MQQTTLEAYRDILPKLTLHHSLVLKSLRFLGEASDREITKLLGVSDPNFVRPRRRELVKLGVVVESDKRVCRVSGKRVIVWSVLT